MDTAPHTFDFPSPEALSASRRMVARTGAGLRLPFRERAWKGAAGNWAGVGIGSSIDFQDHRPYVPGDDPRYINWQAYARSGQYTMKLYREEVSPRVDIAIDCSPSMFAWHDKGCRTMELLYFVADSARQHGASLRIYTIRGTEAAPVENEAADAPDGHHFRPTFPMSEEMPDVSRIPWRRGAMRIFLSDLLYPGSPDALLGILGYGGVGIVLAPWHKNEASPDWEGNLEFVDAETGGKRPQLVDRRLAARYVESYNRHISLWAETARRHNIAFARVSCGDNLTEALLAEALPNGALEQCN